MQGVANVSFLAMFLMYLLAALFGYLTFYGECPGLRAQTRSITAHGWLCQRGNGPSLSVAAVTTVTALY